MMNKKKILEELYESDPSLKLEEEKTEKLVSFLVNHNPNIEAPKAFKTRLGNKLHTIGEFKQIQPKAKRSFMFFMRPLFILVVGVFVLAQFKNYLSMKELNMKNVPELQNLEMLLSEDGKEIDVPSENEQKMIINTGGEESLAGASGSNDDIDIIEVETLDEIEAEPEIESGIEPEIEPEVQEEVEATDLIEDENQEEEQAEDEDEMSSLAIMTASDDAETSDEIETSDATDTPEEPSGDNSSEEAYYSCDDGKIVIEDSIAQRRIIKSYCDSVSGEIMNGGGNIKYYLCTLPSKEEVGVEYIEKELCK